MRHHDRTDRGRAKKEKPRRTADVAKHEVPGAAGGAVAGAIAGSFGGPVGTVTGAVLGGVAGAAAARAMEINEEHESARNEALDEDIGVSGGDLGAPTLKHPPPKIGAYSAASSGAGAETSGAPAEGTIVPPEGER